MKIVMFTLSEALWLAFLLLAAVIGIMALGIGSMCVCYMFLMAI